MQHTPKFPSPFDDIHPSSIQVGEESFACLGIIGLSKPSDPLAITDASYTEPSLQPSTSVSPQDYVQDSVFYNNSSFNYLHGFTESNRDLNTDSLQGLEELNNSLPSDKLIGSIDLKVGFENLAFSDHDPNRPLNDTSDDFIFKPSSAKERLQLVHRLNDLPPTQFEELLFALKPPGGIVPSKYAPQCDRAIALLDYLESPFGPGLAELGDLLYDISLDRSSEMSNYRQNFSSLVISINLEISISAYIDLKQAIQNQEQIASILSILVRGHKNE